MSTSEVASTDSQPFGAGQHVDTKGPWSQVTYGLIMLALWIDMPSSVR